MKVLTNLDLNKNELQNARIQNLATAPSNPEEGQIYYNTTDKKVYKWDGVQWSDMGSSYTLPVATPTVLGGVKVGDGLSATNDGTLSANVISVAGKTGAVNLDKNDVGLGNVDNTSDANKPVSTAVQTALDDKLNLSGGTMTGDIAMGGNKITGLDDPTNSSDAVTKGYVDSVAVGALKPSGSIAFANLPALSANVLNNIYNVTDAFTTTADFVEGAGVDYPAGTNVAIINTGTDQNPVYKYDAMTGTIDTSNFATKTDVNGMVTESTGTIATSATSATVNYTGTLIEAYAKQGTEKVITDMNVSASSVVFTVAQNPDTAVTCVVVSREDLS